MKEIKITTQAEFDALPDKFSEYTQINIYGDIAITKDRESSHVVARGSSHVEARGSSHVVARESSHVVAWGSSHVEARGSSHVVAWGSSHVEARGSSHVEARESSHVVARESSHVVARESSHVVAWESSHVEARESSHVEARGSSHVEAWESNVIIDGLFFWSVLTMCFCVCKVVKKHKTATIVHQVRRAVDKKMFLQTLEKVKEGYILFKSVKPDTLCDFQTGKIKYKGVVTCPDWDKDPNRECGGGLHLSPTPQMALSYHTGTVLRCAVKAVDFVVYQAGDFTKVRCRKVTVLGKAEL